MTWTREQQSAGGKATLAKYGAGHFRRISKGRPPRSRFAERRASHEQPEESHVIPFRPRGRAAGNIVPFRGKGPGAVG